MRITDPVPCNELDWSKEGLFCNYQSYWEKRKVFICSANIVSGRVFDCPCTKKNAKKCGDFEKKI